MAKLEAKCTWQESPRSEIVCGAKRSGRKAAKRAKGQGGRTQAAAIEESAARPQRATGSAAVFRRKVTATEQIASKTLFDR